MKVDDTKRDHDHKVGSNLAKAAQTTGLAHQSSRMGSKKEEGASSERPHIAVTGSVAGKAIPMTGDKKYFPEDQGDQSNQTVNWLYPFSCQSVCLASHRTSYASGISR